MPETKNSEHLTTEIAKFQNESTRRSDSYLAKCDIMANGQPFFIGYFERDKNATSKNMNINLHFSSKRTQNMNIEFDNLQISILKKVYHADACSTVFVEFNNYITMDVLINLVTGHCQYLVIRPCLKL